MKTLQIIMGLFSISFYQGAFSQEVQSHILSGQNTGVTESFAADVDGDGDLDLCVSSWSDLEISWMENLGDNETWHQHILPTENLTPLALDAGDFDGDGDLDLVSGSDNGIIQWHINSGNGVFEEETFVIDTFLEIQKIKTVDLDQDGDVDFLVSAWGVGFNGNVIYYDNLGDGTFSSYITLQDNTHNTDIIEIGDMNNDGFMDVVIHKMEIPPLIHTIIIYYYYGENTFSSQTYPVISTIIGKGGVELADLDGNGWLDIIWFNGYALNGADGFVWDLSWWWWDNEGDPDEGVDVLDIDDDGDLDIVFCTEDIGLFYIEQLPNFEFSDIQTFVDLGVNGTFVDVLDLDGDGQEDILLASSNEGTVWLRNEGDLNFTDIVICGDEEEPLNVSHIDLNNDGWDDVIATSSDIYGASDENGISWYENLEGGYFSTRRTLLTTEGEIIDISIADMDGDGDEDIVGVNEFSEVILFNIEDGVFIQQSVLFSSESVTNSTTLFDLNQDGLMDVIVCHLEGASLLLQIENQSFSEPTVLWENSTKGATVVDMDGDNDFDILMNGNSIVWLENDSGGFTSHEISTSSGIAKYPVLIDIDLDGLNDIVSFSNGGVFWFRNLGGNDFNYESIDGPDDYLRDIAVFDFENDGDVDIVCGYNSYELFLIENSGNGSFSYSQIQSDRVFWFEDMEMFDANNNGFVDLLTASSYDDKIAWHETEGLLIEAGMSENEDVRLMVYPNPTTNNFTVSIKENASSLFLYTLDGKLVKQWNNLSRGERQFMLHDIESGTYILKIKSGKQLARRSLLQIVKH